MRQHHQLALNGNFPKRYKHIADVVGGFGGTVGRGAR